MGIPARHSQHPAVELQLALHHHNCIQYYYTITNDSPRTNREIPEPPSTTQHTMWSLPWYHPQCQSRESHSAQQAVKVHHLVLQAQHEVLHAKLHLAQANASGGASEVLDQEFLRGIPAEVFSKQYDKETSFVT
eukprot:3053254-Rhodomonas_salina.1